MPDISEDLIDHPKAKRRYAWIFKDGNQTRSVTVLELPPVDSPETAVTLKSRNHHPA